MQRVVSTTILPLGTAPRPPISPPPPASTRPAAPTPTADTSTRHLPRSSTGVAAAITPAAVHMPPSTSMCMCRLATPILTSRRRRSQLIPAASHTPRPVRIKTCAWTSHTARTAAAAGTTFRGNGPYVRIIGKRSIQELLSPSLLTFSPPIAKTTNLARTQRAVSGTQALVMTAA